MKIVEFTSRIPTMGNTKTYEDWKKYVGEKPSNLGVVARYYKDNTLDFLTTGLRNVFYNKESENKFQLVDSLVYEWEVESEQIKHVEFYCAPVGTGAGAQDIIMTFVENYYNKYDIIRIDESKQQVIVLSHPIRRADNQWELTVRLIDNNFDSTLDVDACQPGMTTTFQSTANVELSEEGYTKQQSSMSRYRNYITCFRHDVSWSSLYALKENVFMKICDDKDRNKIEGVYKMKKKEKELLDTFTYSVSTGLLLNKGNVDKHGKVTIHEPNTQRPIYIGEGLIPQIEAAANKFVYTNKPTIQLLHMIISAMNERSQDLVGNNYQFIVNQKMWEDIQLVLGSYLADYKTDGTYMYSKSANKGAGGYVKVGATFNSYEFGGNTITFAVDKALTREYPTKGYGLCIDLTADKTSGTPAIAKFSLLNKEFLTATITGVNYTACAA